MSVSEQLKAEIDKAIDDSDETTVVSEGRTEDIEVPQESEDTEATSEGVQEDTQQEDQKDTQVEPQSEDEPEDTPEDSEEDTQGDVQSDGVAESEPAPISDEVLTRAVNAGMSVSEARSLGSDSAINSIANRLETQARQYEAMAQEERDRYTESQQQPQAPVDPFADLPKLDPEIHDSEVIAMFDRLTNITKGQYETIQSFQAAQEQQQAASYSAGRNEIVNWFDKEVEGLGEDFKGELGEGSYSSLDKGSAAFLNRDAIADHMSVLIAGYNAQGIQAPDRSEVFRVASRHILGDRYTAIEGEKLSKQLESQSSQHIQRVNRSKVSATKTAEEQDADIAESIDRQFFGR